MKSYLLNSIIGLIVFLNFNALHSQKVSSSYFLTLGYIETTEGMLPYDSNVMFVQGVKTLFGLSANPVSDALVNPDDTTFYKTLKTLMFSASMPARTEITLYRIEKRAQNNYLKCIVQEKDVDSSMNNVIGTVTFPFVQQGNIIKFKNFFIENSRQQFVGDEQHRVYTNLQNKAKLDSISYYVKNISEKFGIPLNPLNRLFYAYYGANENPYAALGLDDYVLDLSGRQLALNKNDYFIGDKLAKGFYKHEITHFVNNGNIHSRFFNEGLATYLGGNTAKCNRKCSLEKLLSILESDQSDSLIINILSEKYNPHVSYPLYFYPLGAFSIELLIEKYSYHFFENKDLKTILDSNSPQEIYTFLTTQLNNSNKPIRDFYLEKLKDYLSRPDDSSGNDN